MRAAAELMIRNYELGVLFLPSAFCHADPHHGFSCTPSSPIRLISMYDSVFLYSSLLIRIAAAPF